MALLPSVCLFGTRRRRRPPAELDFAPAIRYTAYAAEPRCPCLGFLGGCGGTGRRASLRGCWDVCPVEVRVLSPAPDPSPRFPSAAERRTLRIRRRRQVVKAGVCKTPIGGSNPPVASKPDDSPGWRNWQTRRSQKPLGRKLRVGSIPTLGTGHPMPSGVVVTQQTLDLLSQVRILARQPGQVRWQLEN